MLVQDSINQFYSRIAQIYAATGDTPDVVARKVNLTAGELLSIYRDPDFEKALESTLIEFAGFAEESTGQKFDGDTLTRWKAARKAVRGRPDYDRYPDGWNL